MMLLSRSTIRVELGDVASISFLWDGLRSPRASLLCALTTIVVQSAVFPDVLVDRAQLATPFAAQVWCRQCPCLGYRACQGLPCKSEDGNRRHEGVKG